MRQHVNTKFTYVQDEKGTYVVHHGLDALLPCRDLLIVAMKLVARRLDDPPSMQHGRLVAGHMDRRETSILLPLIKLVEDAFVVLAGGLVGTHPAMTYTMDCVCLLSSS
jgi:hypothetical protein